MGGLVNEVGSLLGGGNNNSQTTTQGAGGVGTSAIQNPVTAQQATDAYGNVVNAQGQGSALASALAGQNGIANQSSVFQQQQNLANALQQQAAGGGPNPAQAQLNQNTGTNVANQAALMAGQRGAGANVGLIARQAAQQGAATQQNAVGTAATLQAQQQLAAQQQLQAQQSSMAGLATNQVGQQINQTNTNTTNAMQEQGNLLSGVNAQNNANVGMQSNMNSGNMAMAQTNANNSAGAVGGLLNSAGGAMASMMSKGGVVGEDGKDPKANKKLAKVAKKDRMPLPDHIKGMASIFHPKHFADGGEVQEVQNVGSASDPSPNDSPQSNSSPLKSQSTWTFGQGGKASPGEGGSSGGDSGGGGMMAGGPMDAMGGDSSGGMASMAALAASKGAIVPGKAKVKGDSQKNDTVPAMLSAGEIVIPRHVTQSEDPVGNSEKFVAALLEKHGQSLGKEEGDFKDALKKAISSRKK